MEEEIINEEIISEDSNTESKTDKVLNNKDNTEKVKKQSIGIDAFVASIISILSTPFWYICLPTSIYSLVRSVIYAKKSGHSLSKAAFIISVIALTIFVAIHTQAIVAVILNS